jgi:hypothetical protein
MSSIFVQIPAYRDFELPKTIKDCINQSSGNNTIRFGVHNCVAFEGEVTVAKQASVSIKTSIAPENIGVNASRYIANEFYDGEDYYLQIDSHMRFVKNWDEIYVQAVVKYQDMGLAKPLVTQYPSGYTYDDNGKEKYDKNLTFYQTGIWFGENVKQFEETLIPTQTAKVLSDNCGFTKSVSGGNIFTLGEFAHIKPNPKIAFWGEEPLIAARAFTHGFDLVMPFAHSVYHLYHSKQPFAKVRRHHVWQDYPDIWQVKDRESKEEYRRIFENKVVGEFALGTARSLDDYEEFTGLDFTNRTIVATRNA